MALSQCVLFVEHEKRQAWNLSSRSRTADCRSHNSCQMTMAGQRDFAYLQWFSASSLAYVRSGTHHVMSLKDGQCPQVGTRTCNATSRVGLWSISNLEEVKIHVMKILALGIIHGRMSILDIQRMSRSIPWSPSQRHLVPSLPPASAQQAP